MRKVLTIAIIIPLAIGLNACGGQHSRVYKKQRMPSVIKIDKLDLSTKTIALRFNYRSYVEKTLEKIQCDVSINQDINLKLEKSPQIKLGAFATEVLNFNTIELNIKKSTEINALDYSLTCQINYNQGQEYLMETSVLQLAPSEQFIYR